MEFPGRIPCASVSVSGDLLSLVPIGDAHIGSIGCDEEKVAEAVAEGCLPDTLIFITGDVVDGIVPGDKRWENAIANGKQLDDLVPNQFLRAIELLKPATGRIIGAMMGNHDGHWLAQHGVRIIWKWFLDQIATRDLGTSCFFDVAVWFRDADGTRRKSGAPADKTVRLTSVHGGSGGGNTYGGKINAGMRWGDGTYGADVIVFPHTHMMSGILDPKLGANADCSDSAVHNQLTVWSGGFLRSYIPSVTTYPERKAMRPVALGAPVIRIYPHRTRVEIG